MSERSLRVAVLSPQPMMVERLRAILATMDGGVELVPLGRSEPDPDVVLYDAIGLVHGDRTDLKMLVDKTTACLFVISREPRRGLAALALAAGADGHFSLGADDEQILEAIESAVADLRLGEAADGAVLGSGGAGTAPDVPPDGRCLSRREAQLLDLVGRGWSNSEIAEELRLGPHTVKTCIRAACRAIGARNRAEAARWVLAHPVTRPDAEQVTEQVEDLDGRASRARIRDTAASY